MMDNQKKPEYQDMIKTAYAAFNARDIDGVLQVMHPTVKWARAWEGDYAVGHEDVRSYWERQWQEINPTVTPVGFTQRADGRLEVQVDQLVKDNEGTVIFSGIVKHVYLINDGLFQQMDVEAK